MKAPHRPILDPRTSLDDANARRIVGMMLAALHHDCTEVVEATVKAQRFGSSSLGSPVAQRRFYDKLRKHAHRALLSSHLKTGNRGHYAMQLVVWQPSRAFVAGRFHHLSVLNESLIGVGNHDTKSRYDSLLELQDHALVRCLQRSGARTADDLVVVLRSVWRAAVVSLHAIARGNPAPAFGARGWLLPVRGVDGRRIFAVATQGRDGFIIEVPTILADYQVQASPLVDELEQLVDSCIAAGELGQHQTARLVELLTASIDLA